VVRIISLLLLISVASSEAGQVGRTTSQVNFREGPSRSARVINILAAGTEVSILREDPGGWYLVIHQGQPGFIHKNYVNLEHHQNSARWFDSLSGHLAMPAGMILVSIGVIAIAYVLAPFLLTIAVVLAGSLMAVVVLDLGFQLGVLYSLFSVSLGLVIAILFLTRKRAA
jgi:uncharacterized protein YraI